MRCVSIHAFLLLKLPASAVAFVLPTSLPNGSIRPFTKAATSFPAKNFADEILDALDTMVGVSPLSEEDLKTENVNLVQRAEERNEAAPPSDALQKPSVAVFFAILAIIPVILSFAAIKSGVRPFGL